MAFVIHGRDPRTGEKTDPFFSNATTEEAARAEATTQGVAVDLVERHEDRSPAAGTSLSTLGTAQPMEVVESQYEFLPHHNRIIGGLASTMRNFGIALMVLGILYVVSILAVPREFMPAPLVPAVLALMLGGLLIYGAEPFRRIVRTQGHDVDHLMEALTRLRFTFELMLFVAMLVAATVIVMVVMRS